MFETIAFGLAPVLRLSLLALSAWFASLLFRWLRLPEFLGALAAGMVLGPSVADVFGVDQSAANQAFQAWAFDFFYWSGLSILMFTAGNSISFARYKGNGIRTWVLAVCALAVLVPAYLTSGFVIKFTGGNPMPPGREAHAYQMVFTLCAVVTSVPFLTKILRERQLLATGFSKTVLLAACVVDLVLWLLLSVVHKLHQDGMTDALGIGNALWPNLTIYFVTFLVIALIRLFGTQHESLISGPRTELVFGTGLLLAAIAAAAAIGGEVIASSLCKNLIFFRVGIGINNYAFIVHGVEIWRLLKLG